jgi:hypothetical protein
MMTLEDLTSMVAPLFFQPNPIASQASSPKSGPQGKSKAPSSSNEEYQAIVDDEALMSDLSLLFEAILSNLRALECLRERISKRKTFPRDVAFDYCDFDGDGRLSIEDLK